MIVKAGETLHIPANALHQFKNESGRSVRLLCLCAPAGQEEFFAQVGTAVATRTTPPPPADAVAMEAMKAKTEELASKYKTEFLEDA